MEHLIEDPYGNYLIQNVLKLNDNIRSEKIFTKIARHFIRLSQLKFSSNVIEKCLERRLKDSKGIACIEHIFRGSYHNDDHEIIKKNGKNSKISKDFKWRVSFIVQ